MAPRPMMTLLHVSDPQFGKDHLFASAGLTAADQHYDSLFARLHEDLRTLRERNRLQPELLVVSGDLAEWGRRSEFEQVHEFLVALAEQLRLPRRRVVIVPGNHDINRDSCEAYFLRCKANEEDPVAPYWPKWEHFAGMFNRFYQGEADITFTNDQPWTLYELPDLKVVVAGVKELRGIG